MEPLSKIANTALDEITQGQFIGLSSTAITGLLNDFHYAWLRRLKIPYKFEMLDFARGMCNRENKTLFEATKCENVKEVRRKFSYYIKKWHKKDDRVILSLSFDGKQIDTKWIELEEYLKTHQEV